MYTPPIATIGALIGEPARAIMLSALMDGCARTASELAGAAGITRQTASAHLAKLMHGGLLALERQGRHRYFRLAGPEVADALETLMVLGEQRPERHPRRVATPVRDARTCYDHLAGHLGVRLLDSLGANGHLGIDGPRIALSSSGLVLARKMGIDVDALQRRRRPFARLCLDWSERRNHLAGSLGAVFLSYFSSQDWLRQQSSSRAVSLTSKGRRGFKRVFGLSC